MKKGTGGTNVGDQVLFVGNVCSRRPDSVRLSALVVSRKTRATAYITGICDVSLRTVSTSSAQKVARFDHRFLPPPPVLKYMKKHERMHFFACP